MKTHEKPSYSYEEYIRRNTFLMLWPAWLFIAEAAVLAILGVILEFAL